MSEGFLRELFLDDAPLGVECWGELEEALLRLDFGPVMADEIVREVRGRAAAARVVCGRDLRELVEDVLVERLSEFDTTLNLGVRPAVVLVVGVNGVGKTTTIAKFAHFLRAFEKRVLVAAADTFRAAAVEQLVTWAGRAGADVQRPDVAGQDPAAVAYKAVSRAVAAGHDVVVVDTAGRLQSKSGLMEELAKVRRVVEKQVAVAEVLLVLDATVGQNGLMQAEAFIESVGVTGLVLTKLDGSAKAGFIFSVQKQTGLAVKLVGRGEGIGDLRGFTPRVFVHEMFA